MQKTQRFSHIHLKIESLLSKLLHYVVLNHNGLGAQEQPTLQYRTYNLGTTKVLEQGSLT